MSEDLSTIKLNSTRRNNSTSHLMNENADFYHHHQNHNPDANNNNLTVKTTITARKSSFDVDASSVSSNKANAPVFTAKSVDDESYILEEDKGDCIYVIHYKKVLNRNRATGGSQASSGKSAQTDADRINPYGTYRLMTPLFCSYLHNDSLNSNFSNSSGIDVASIGSASSPGSSSTTDGLVYSRVKIKQLKYATIPKFIEHLTSDETGELDMSLVWTFLTTYRTFTDTQTVLRLVAERYSHILPASLEMTEDVRLESIRSIKTFVRLWLDNFSEDFNEPPDYLNLNELNKFAHGQLLDAELIKSIRAKFETFEKLANPDATTDDSAANVNKLNMSDNDHAFNKSNLLSPSGKSLHRRSYSNLAQTNSADGALFNSIVHSRSHVNLDAENQLLNSLSIKDDDDENSLFLSADSTYVGEQLTYQDKRLFQNIIAHQCLGSVWSTRYQKTASHKPTTSTSSNNFMSPGVGEFAGQTSAKSSVSTSFVTTTANSQLNQSTTSTSTTPVLSDKFAPMKSFIDQFNIVSFAVQGTILQKLHLKPAERAKIINKWIEIALVCRKLKNYYSLNAIIQGLNTQCISRLEKTWNEVAPDLKMQFNQLTELMSPEENYKALRETLQKDLNEYKDCYLSNDQLAAKGFNLNQIYQIECTPKYAEINSGINATLSRKMKERITKKNNSYLRDPVGIIPYLGTFIKDLEFMSVSKDVKNERGLINVLQKRKEYETIAEIKLMQKASQLYSIKHDTNFGKWLSSLPSYSEVQNYDLSYVIEPKFSRELRSNSSSSNNRKGKMGLSQGSRSESVESIASSNMFTNGTSKTPSSVSKQIFKFNHSRNSSMGSSADIIENHMGKSMIDSPQSNSDNQSTNTSNSIDGYSTMPKQAGSSKLSANASASALPTSSCSSEMRVKVNIESNEINTNDSGVLYKKMFINDKLRTKDVKRLILQKFFLNPDNFDKYTLVQILNPATNTTSPSYVNSTTGVDANANPNELIIKDNCNVFYAAKTMPDMQFVLRPTNVKHNFSYDQISSDASSSNSVPNGYKKNNFMSNLAKMNRNLNSSYNHLPPHSPSKQSGASTKNWLIKKILS